MKARAAAAGDPASVTDGRVRRAELLRETRRGEILDVAAEVFGRKGYHQATIGDVIEAAGIARGTFYLYFDSKAAIFRELLDRLMKELRGAVSGVSVGEGALPVRTQVLSIIGRLVQTVGGNRSLVTVLLREPVGLDPDIDRKLGQFYGELRAFISSALEAGQALGIVRAIDPALAAACVLGSIKHTLETHFIGADPSTVGERELTRALVDFNLGALLA